MGSESKNQRRAREQAAREAAKALQIKPIEAMAKSIDLGLEAAIEASEEVYNSMPDPQVPPMLAIHTHKNVEAYIAASKAKDVYDSLRRALDEKTLILDRDTAELSEKSKLIEQEKSKNESDRAQLLVLEADLNERLELVESKEKAAKDGFRIQLLGEQQEWKKKQEADETALNELSHRIQSDKKSFERNVRQLDDDRAMLDEDRAAFNEKVDRRAAAIAAADRQDLEIARSRLVQANSAISDLNVELDKFRSEQWRGGGDLMEITSRYRDLQQAYDGIKDSYATYPSPTEIERLRSQDQELHELREQIRSLTVERSSLSIRMGRMIQGVGELESLRDQKESAEAQLKIVREELRKLTVQIEGEDNADGTFPGLKSIDNDVTFQSQSNLKKWSLGAGLSTFVKDLQQTIKFEGFDYSLLDLRCFIAGLAMSRLHIIQGISGTGKTSLPRLFAQSVNGGISGQGLKIVEVQAGWRDRQDLLGYYNAFEKTYRQTEFLRALYEAQTPRFKDTPYIIILDEMNLSRPEQYFADLLSALESASGDGDGEQKTLVLMDRPIDDAPKLFIDKRKIVIPPNVWFVGTANHDETTLEFADKTYDRSHVLELPHDPIKVDVGAISQSGRLSFVELQKLFSSSFVTHAGAVDKAKKFVVEFIEPVLAKRFGIGIGNRLKQRQLGMFVPVFIESGGLLGDAIDHILVTRILNKTTGLHDTTAEQFRDLASELRKGWTNLALPGRPKRTVQLIDSEVKEKEPNNIASVWL